MITSGNILDSTISYHVHCGAARFALSCGLHRLTSHVFNSPVYTDLISSNVVLLQPPANEIEVGNRIATFWMIYMCDKISSVIAGFVCALPCESDAVDAVETVFPRTMKEYELVFHLLHIFVNRSLTFELLLGVGNG